MSERLWVRETETETETEKKRDRERDRERETERETERHTERDRERGRERDRETESFQRGHCGLILTANRKHTNAHTNTRVLHVFPFIFQGVNPLAPSLVPPRPRLVTSSNDFGLGATGAGSSVDLAEGHTAFGNARRKIPLSIPAEAVVEVSLHGGEDFVGAPSTFQFHARPRVDRVSPIDGPVYGGNKVKLFGEGFVNSKNITVRVLLEDGRIIFVSAKYISRVKVEFRMPSVGSVGDNTLQVRHERCEIRTRSTCFPTTYHHCFAYPEN